MNPRCNSVGARARPALPGLVLGTGIVLVCATLSLAAACGSRGAAKPSAEAELTSKMRMAQAYLRTGRMGEALEVMKEVTRLDPGNAGFQNFYGQIFLLSGRYPEAEAAFEKALELDPHLTDAHNNLGALYDETGRDAEAEREYSRALEDPGYPTPEKVHLNLGILYASQGRDAEALQSLRRAVEISPKYLKAHLELAGLLDRGGRLEEAAREYEVAMPEYRNSGDFLYRLGFVYFRLGDHVKASEQLHRILELAPGSESAARADELLKMIH